METHLVSDEEWQILYDYKHQSPYVLVRLKSEAMLLLHEGVELRIIARIVRRSVETVKEWVKQWNQTRLAAINSGHIGNLNAAKYTAEQREEIVQTLSTPPGERNIPVEFWTVPDLAEWVYSRFGIVYASPSSYHYLLHLAGLSFHRPEAVDQRRGDEQAIAQRMQQIRKQVAPLLEDPDVLVVSADEVKIEHEALLRRAWYQRGQKTRLRVDRRRQTQSYIGFLHERTGHVDLLPLEWQNSNTIVDALTELTSRYPDKQIYIIWDNAAWHRSATLRSHLGNGNPLEAIHLINLPPYCPDHNPIEHVWNEGKNSISNQQKATFTATKTAFETYITTTAFPYRLMPPNSNTETTPDTPK